MLLGALTALLVAAAAGVSVVVVCGAGWVGERRGVIAGWVRRVAHHEPMRGILRRYGPKAQVLRDRLHPGGVFGLELTLGLAAMIALSVAVGALLEDVTSGHGIALVDRPVAQFVRERRTADLTSFMRAVSLVGGPVGIAVLALGCAAACAIARRCWTPVSLVALGAAGVSVIDVAFKAAVGRSRPPLAQAVDTVTGYAFPSGHAAGATATLTVLAYALTPGARRQVVRAGVWAAAVAGAVVVSASRVYLGVHWLTDVIGGMLVGALWAVIVVTAWNTLRRADDAHRGSRGHGARVP